MNDVRNNEGDASHSRSTGAFIGLAVIALACLAAGIGMLTVRHISMRDRAAMREWTATPCVVERCEFVHDDEGERYLQLTYRYTVDGKFFTGDRLDAIIGRMGDDDEFEERIHNAYPPGAQAVCYIDPADPNRSVFDRDHGADAPRRMWLLAFPFMCVGVAFALGLVGSLIGGRTNNKPISNRNADTLELFKSPPPRSIPPLMRLAVFAGPASTQIVWLFVVGCTYVFVIMDGPASYARLLNIWHDEATTTGRVTDVREMDQPELNGNGFRYEIAYSVEGKPHQSTGYSRGEKYDKAEEVQVAYDVDDPSNGRIADARPGGMTWWHSAIPLGVLLLLATGLVGMYLHNFRSQWLLARGILTRATWPEPTTYREGIDDGPGQTIESKYRFNVNDRDYSARWFAAPNKGNRRVPGNSKRKPGDRVNVLYRADKPKWNVILDESLLAMVGNSRSRLDRMIDCLLAPIAITLIVILLRFGGLS